MFALTLRTWMKDKIEDLMYTYPSMIFDII